MRPRRHSPRSKRRCPTARVGVVFETLKQHTDLSTTQGQARMMDEAIPYLRQMPDGPLRKLMIRDLANLVGSDSDFIESSLGSASSGTKASRPPLRPQQKTGNENLIGKIISMLLYQPDLGLRLKDLSGLDGVPLAGMDFLTELLQLIQANTAINCAGILEHWRDSRYEARLKQLAASNNELFSVSTNLESEFDDAISRLLDLKTRKKLQQLANTRPSKMSEEDKEALRNLGKSKPKN